MLSKIFDIVTKFTWINAIGCPTSYTNTHTHTWDVHIYLYKTNVSPKKVTFVNFLFKQRCYCLMPYQIVTDAMIDKRLYKHLVVHKFLLYIYKDELWRLFPITHVYFYRDPGCLDLSNICGFILNVPSDYKLGFVMLPLRRRHWITIRQIHGNFYNLDSKLDAPQLIGRVILPIISTYMNA